MQYELLQEGQGGITSATSKRQKKSNELFRAPESAVVPQVAQAMDRNQTWSDKLQDWLTSILEPKWSERLAAVPTSKDQSSLTLA